MRISRGISKSPLSADSPHPNFGQSNANQQLLRARPRRLLDDANAFGLDDSRLAQHRSEHRKRIGGARSRRRDRPDAPTRFERPKEARPHPKRARDRNVRAVRIEKKSLLRGIERHSPFRDARRVKYLTRLA